MLPTLLTNNKVYRFLYFPWLSFLFHAIRRNLIISALVHFQTRQQN
jgi:hypothetical protein